VLAIAIALALCASCDAIPNCVGHGIIVGIVSAMTMALNHRAR